MKRRWSSVFEARGEFGPEVFVPGRKFRKTFPQSFEVKTRSPHQNRPPALLQNFLDQPLGVFGKVAGGVNLIGRKMSDQMMGDPFDQEALVFPNAVGSGGADFKSPVNLPRINGDDLAV